MPRVRPETPPPAAEARRPVARLTVLLGLAACSGPTAGPASSGPAAPPPARPEAPAASTLAAPAAPVPEDTSFQPVPEGIPSGLVDLRLALPDACFDIRYASADNFTGAPLPGYASPGAWLRERPAAALQRVEAALRDHGLTLLIYDAYRPARASLAMVEWAERSGRRRLLGDGYIARRSGHNRGDTVDLTLARPGACEPLDMGSAWDHFGPESHYSGATGEAMQRRRLLRRAMRSAGFFPYDKEWWHFTLRDPAAAPLDRPYPPSP